ncbi:MAG: SPOR domain-containing protein [Prevotellaceae bacterium]|nr:SPOR domain-containing protein [Prevotellaceae bacterium]
MKKVTVIIAFAVASGSVAVAQVQGSINVKAQPAVEQLVQRHITYNIQHPKIEGYRIRIYRDNSNNARQRSQDVSENFSELFSDIPAYRSYDNPYFKVSVGDFRAKDDALRLYMRIKRLYPRAYIVQESINFPAL